MRIDTAPFHPGLVTAVRAVAYDFVERRGHIVVPPGCCVDMTGAIDLMQTIDPQVREIETVAGQIPDMVYRRRGRTWQALDRRPDPSTVLHELDELEQRP